MELKKLIENVETLSVDGTLDLNITGITLDSRRARAGHLFAALPGAHADGANFIDDATGRGALAVVSQEPAPAGSRHTHIRVTDARQALGDISTRFFCNPSSRLRTVGITGTNGKTSVAFMVRDVLRESGIVPGMLGTVRYEIGARSIPSNRTTPEAPDLHAALAEMIGVGCEAAVIEVTSHGLMQKRVWGVDFDVCIFTNLTQDHLDYHGTMEDYFAAKSLLFKWAAERNPDSVAVTNIDDEYGRRLAGMQGIPGQVITYGCAEQADVRATAVQHSEQGSRFEVHTPWGIENVELPILGHFNVHNALAAIAACGAMNLPLADIVKHVANCHAIPGRLEEVPGGRGFRVLVDYAHTDDALRNVLQTIRPTTPGRIILVFGCGGKRDTGKRSMMGAVADDLADYSIITSDNPRTEDPDRIIEQIEQGFGQTDNHIAIPDREKAISHALDMAKKGDTVLVAGKGHETFQEFANTTVPFDDRQVVSRLLEK